MVMVLHFVDVLSKYWIKEQGNIVLLSIDLGKEKVNDWLFPSITMENVSSVG